MSQGEKHLRRYINNSDDCTTLRKYIKRDFVLIMTQWVSIHISWYKKETKSRLKITDIKTIYVLTVDVWNQLKNCGLVPCELFALMALKSKVFLTHLQCFFSGSVQPEPSHLSLYWEHILVCMDTHTCAQICTHKHIGHTCTHMYTVTYVHTCTHMWGFNRALGWLFC